jgi:exosortase/archaeosortase family protein
MRRQERDALNMTLIALACALLMVLPLVTTFDDLLSAVGIKAAASGSHMVVWDGSGSMHVLLISWNCIGWQSLVLLGASFISGLRGHQPLEARVQIVVIGVAGTMLLNLLRVAAVAALAATWGQTAAVLFHDYGGTLLVVGWLFAFWMFVQRWILPADPSDQPELATT